MEERSEAPAAGEESVVMRIMAPPKARFSREIENLVGDLDFIWDFS